MQLAGATGFTVAASGRGGYAVAQTPAAIGSYAQSPLFDEQDLPPVEERLPANPLVVQPNESVGRYGGTWRTALIGGQDTPWLDRTVGYDNLVRWSVDWSEIIPNVAESFEVSDDARTYTFRLRAGHKWSDGAPFTTEDIQFTFDAVLGYPEIGVAAGDNPMTLEVVDEQEFSITFERPDGLYLQQLCRPANDPWTVFPKHYLSQFHKDYNTENLDELVEEAGEPSWLELFMKKGITIYSTPTIALWTNPELPRLHGWQLVDPYGDGTQMLVRRNPYYFKVDPEGNQLPYLDEIRYELLEDSEVLLLKASAGEVDIHSRHINTNTNKPVLAENRETGEYTFFDIVPSNMNTVALALNQTHKNEALREVFANHDFRLGLSHAINRQEIIDVVYVSQGEPWHLAPRPETAFFSETLAKVGTEYDVDRANELLDSVVPDKDGNGMRLLPSGDALTFVVEVTADQTERVDATNLIIGYWQAVGIQAELSPQDRSLVYTRKNANEHDAMVWGGDGGLSDAILDPRWYIPISDEANYGIGWYIWYAKPGDPLAEAVEPPAPIQEALGLYDELKTVADPEQQNALFSEILAIAEEQFHAIGVSLPAAEYGIRKNYVRNVPDVMPGATVYPTPGPTNPEQYWFDV
jgi:peptide/nickel transport system substrate-binding protein